MTAMIMDETRTVETVDRSESTQTTDAQTTNEDLFLEFASATGRQRARLRQQLIQRHLPMAEAAARRFAQRGEALDDLQQVAALGLIKAVDGFDPRRGSSFAGYAIPTMLGELRRHFRDKGWDVRVPRRLQELRADINAVRDGVTQQLGHTAAPAEIAEALGRDEAEVTEALVAAQGYSAMSLSDAGGPGQTHQALTERLSRDEPGYEEVETQQVLRGAMRRLSARERRIVGLRYYHQLSQCEIAGELGISQMHVSRLLSRSLRTMRASLDDDLRLAC